jgi:hypothetical protein
VSYTPFRGSRLSGTSEKCPGMAGTSPGRGYTAARPGSGPRCDNSVATYVAPTGGQGVVSYAPFRGSRLSGTTEKCPGMAGASPGRGYTAARPGSGPRCDNPVATYIAPTGGGWVQDPGATIRSRLTSLLQGRGWVQDPNATIRSRRTSLLLGGREGGSRPISRVLSWAIIHLGLPSPAASCNLPESSAGRIIAFLFGLAPGGVYHAAACCHLRGALLPHHFTLTFRRRRYLFCCTFRRLAPPRRYLAPCPVEPGLSSTRRKRAAIAWPTPTLIVLESWIYVKKTVGRQGQSEPVSSRAWYTSRRGTPCIFEAIRAAWLAPTCAFNSAASATACPREPSAMPLLPLTRITNSPRR